MQHYIFRIFYMMSIVDLFISWILLSYVVSTHTVLNQRELKENGYDCGDIFFNDQMIHDALQNAKSEKGREKILPYSGSLYSQAMRYITWPIFPIESKPDPTKQSFLSEIWRKATYQIVFDANGKLIDIIVRLADNQFAKCWKVESQRSEASIYSVEGSNGYECGSEFISDITIAESTSVAYDNLCRARKYPSQYKGNLYSEDLDYKIWPIHYKTSTIHRNSNKPTGSLYIVIDSTGQLKDVIVKTWKKNHIRCMRARKVLPAPENDELSRMFAKPPRTGYLCDEIFFDDHHMQIASQVAERKKRFNWRNGFPKRHDGEPYNLPCLLWPIKKNGESYRTGGMDKYRLVLSLDFKVISVAMKHEKLVPCERRVIPGGYQDEVPKSYRCYGDVFSHNELVSVAEIACKKLRHSKRVLYPAPYKGEEFDVEGPYVIYPIIKNKRFHSSPGIHRLVINHRCHIAGVLTQHQVTQELVKCSVEKTEVFQER